MENASIELASSFSTTLISRVFFVRRTVSSQYTSSQTDDDRHADSNTPPFAISKGWPKTQGREIIDEQAPIEFIRTIRLKRAAFLLAKSGKTVAEIAYETGFNNPKKFAKFFQEEFNVLPSQYHKNISKNEDI